MVRFGTLMARALCDCHFVHAPLCAFLFKHILNRSESIGMADLRQVDPRTLRRCNGWVTILSTVFCLRHSSRRDLGAKEEKELVPGGKV